MPYFLKFLVAVKPSDVGSSLVHSDCWDLIGSFGCEALFMTLLEVWHSEGRCNRTVSGASKRSHALYPAGQL